jgi:hypothetical protein
MIFARDVSDSLTSLVKKVDAATVKHNKEKMGSFAVFCNDDAELKNRLKDLAKKEDLKELILTQFEQAGPEKYKVAKDADITVILYDERTVVANYAFKKGEFKEADVNAIMKDVDKMLAAAKKSKDK